MLLGIMKIILATFIIFFSTSLISNEVQLYKKVSDNIPKVEVENTVYMGDRMLEQRTGMFSECLTPLFSDEKRKLGGWVLSIRANEPLCKYKEKDKGYYPSYINGVSPSDMDDVEDVIYEVRLKGKKEGKYKICLVLAGLNAHCVKKLSSDDYKFETVFVFEKDSLQRVIEYAGKKGTIIKFIYSEFKDNMARDAFTREFEIDLNEGTTVAYKGAIFEIIEANNATIKYKVIRHFEK